MSTPLSSSLVCVRTCDAACSPFLRVNHLICPGVDVDRTPFALFTAVHAQFHGRDGITELGRTPVATAGSGSVKDAFSFPLPKRATSVSFNSAPHLHSMVLVHGAGMPIHGLLFGALCAACFFTIMRMVVVMLFWQWR
jgi:hypothetical protein